MQRWTSFRTNTPVSEARPIGNDFEVLRPAGTAIARSVVIATGNLNVPRKPAGATQLPASVSQQKGLSAPGVFLAGLDSPESLMAGTIVVAENESKDIVTHIMANRGTRRAQ